MTKKKKLKIALLIGIPVFVIIAVIVAVVIIIDQGIIPGEPFYLIEGELSDVECIEIFDGNSGTKAIIDRGNGLEEVVENFRTVKLQRAEKLEKKSGFSYSTTIVYKNGDESNFTIQSSLYVKSMGYRYDVLEGQIDYVLLSKYVDQAILDDDVENQSLKVFESSYDSDSIRSIGIIDSKTDTAVLIKDSDDIKTILKSFDQIELSAKAHSDGSCYNYKYILYVEHPGRTCYYYINGETDMRDENLIFNFNKGKLDLALIESMIEKYRNSDILE